MFRKARTFLRETRTELVDKTTWPTKDAVLSSTVVVIHIDYSGVDLSFHCGYWGESGGSVCGGASCEGSGSVCEWIHVCWVHCGVDLSALHVWEDKEEVRIGMGLG